MYNNYLLIYQADSLTIMREKCSQNPNAEECTQIKLQMEDLLRKCSAMATPVSACDDVKNKYCFIWPRELYCYSSGGGGQVRFKYIVFFLILYF
jgi:hypothetical protein